VTKMRTKSNTREKRNGEIKSKGGDRKKKRGGREEGRSIDRGGKRGRETAKRMFGDEIGGNATGCQGPFKT